jgi:hypothetical protein
MLRIDKYEVFTKTLSFNWLFFFINVPHLVWNFYFPNPSVAAGLELF